MSTETKTETLIRRDAVKPGMIVRSSHGYDLLVTHVDDSAPSRADDRHVGIVGHLHGNPYLPVRTERYPASSKIRVLEGMGNFVRRILDDEEWTTTVVLASLRAMAALEGADVHGRTVDGDDAAMTARSVLRSALLDVSAMRRAIGAA